jgi:hypothetical protein
MAEGMWRRHYGADPDVLGRSIVIAGRPFVVIGISPPGFPGLRLSDRGTDPEAAPQLWLPLGAAEAPRHTPWLAVGGRLSRDADPKTLQALLALVATNARRESTVARGHAVLHWFRAGLDWRSDPRGASLNVVAALGVWIASKRDAS